MPRRAWMYIWFIFLSGILAVVLAFSDFITTSDLSTQWFTLLVLTIFATLTQLYKSEAPDHQLYHTTLIFQFAGVVLLHPFLFFFLILIPHLAEWGRERLILVDSPHLRDWYLQPFNISVHVIAGSFAHLILVGLSVLLIGLGDVSSLIAALAAASTYVLLNHLYVGLALTFARSVSLRESGIMGLDSLSTDFVTLLMGYSVAVIWEINPWLILIALAPLILIYRALSIPILKRQAQMDSKTEVWNAGYFKKALQTELNRAQELDRPMTLVMADLDYLRHINNTYGHLAGDAVLQGIAKIMRESSHTYDIVARFGGEEFSILMPETTAEQAFQRTEKIRKAMEAASFDVDTNDEPIKATMSFGVAPRLGDKQTTTELIHCADIAMYQAKENGRNRTHLYDYINDGHIKIPDAANNTDTATDSGTTINDDPKTTHESDITNEQKTIHDETETGTTTIGAVFSDDLVAISKKLPSEAPPAEPLEIPKQTLQQPAPSHEAVQKTNAYIYTVSFFALALAVFSIQYQSINSIDWVGIMVFASLVLLVEALSIEIHARDTTVSTSVAPYLASVLLFGPIAAIIIAPLIALINHIKRRGPISRFIFNISNHMISGLLVAIIVMLSNNDLTDWHILIQILFSIAITGLVYLISTVLLAIAISLSTNQPFGWVWSDGFRWLAPYYLSLGFVVYALIFSYVAVGILGILIILIPLLMLRFSQKQYMDHTEKLVVQLRANNKQLRIQSDEIILLNEELLLTLARSIDLRDPYVMEHAKNVARYAVLTAEEMGLPADQVEHIRKAGLLHDIGKLGIPEIILFKTTSLTDDEYNLIKEHVNIGADLIYGCHSLHNLIPFVKHHHERFDGRGYPDGLTAEEIPLEARILNLADTVEAMASDRPYKLAESPEAILEEVINCSGGQFDPVVVDAFSRVVAKNGRSIIVNSARNVTADEYASIKSFS